MRIIFFALGICVGALSLWLRRMNALAQAWPVANGVVISSGISSDTHDGERSVEVKYRFTVETRDFTSTCISFSPVRADPKSQEQLIGRFPAGSAVDVFFDPENPTRSILIRDHSNSWKWLTVTGAVFVAVAALSP